ncbi:MAG TPA: hypothetical protein PKA88_23650 [Polyangiaceae bacterium]|nr:hypothetical protein [Polyangiaceae bacterium]HMR73895.1 hypothetical protein [Polyangiaceae bacterium]
MKRNSLIRTGVVAVCALTAAACAAGMPSPNNTALTPAQTPAPEAEPAKAPPASQPPSPRATGVCAEMNRHDCMHSPDCVLEAVPDGSHPGKYRCRAATSACEKDLAQIAFYESTPPEGLCTSRPGCRYEKPGCYCMCRGYGQTSAADGAESPECDCVCAGGNPPLCVDAK